MSGKASGRGWFLALAAALGIAITLALGFWQMSRAAEKLALQEAIEERKNMAPLDTQSLLAQDARRWVHRPVILRGAWLAHHTVFLDNRQMHGKPGFYVVTPLKLEGSDKAVLVERGWVQRNFMERERLPVVATPGGAVELRGRLAPGPAKLYQLGEAGSGAIRQNLDVAAYRTETGLELLDVSVQQTGGSPDGLVRDWPEPATGIEKHYGYAAQWWALSILIATLYAWFQFIAPRRKASRA